VQDDPQLSRKARTVLASLTTEVYVSASSAWRLPPKFESANWRLRQLGFRELPITVEHGQRAGLLPGAHKDPFDRMLIAQAQAENLCIVSNESIFDEYHVQRLW